MWVNNHIFAWLTAFVEAKMLLNYNVIAMQSSLKAAFFNYPSALAFAYKLQLIMELSLNRWNGHCHFINNNICACNPTHIDREREWRLLKFDFEHISLSWIFLSFKYNMHELKPIKKAMAIKRIHARMANNSSTFVHWMNECWAHFGHRRINI